MESETDGGSSTPSPSPTTPEPSPEDRSADCVPDADGGYVGAPHAGMVPLASFELPGGIRPISMPEGWADPITGADGPRLWDRIVLSERSRVARYHRPVTVAFAEIVGLDDLAANWGWDVSERALASCSRRLGREIRTSDHLARLERTQFGILLTETAEVAAINFVERARASCERELAAAGTGVRIGFGWASPPEDGDLSDAIELALKRLTADLSAAQPD